MKLVRSGLALLGALALGSPAAATVCNAGPFAVIFARASASLDAEQAAFLDTVAGWYRACPGTEVRLAGFADPSGSAAYNRALSHRRGEAVRAGLIERGIPSQAIVVEAFGEDTAVSTLSRDPRIPVRRVEITFRARS